MVRFYGDIQKVDAEQRMVWGYASTEAVDISGEIILKSALADALDDYMKWANVREMHRPSAVGTTEEATIDEKGLYIGAKIVDDVAWAKVQAGVYKGFSIGGKALARDPKKRNVVTKMALLEISLADRPQNPETKFDIWKASGADPEAGADSSEDIAKALAALSSRVDEIIDVYNARFDAFEAGRDGAVRKVADGVDPLLKAVTALREENGALTRRLAIVEAQPLPAKTAGPGATRAVEKARDSEGLNARDAASSLSTEDVKKSLDSMSAEDRAHVIMKAAMSMPLALGGGVR